MIFCREAAALKSQASELTEAERLEQAALARRERAVAHGAHPDHKFLGGHNPNTSTNMGGNADASNFNGNRFDASGTGNQAGRGGYQY